MNINIKRKSQENRENNLINNIFNININKNYEKFNSQNLFKSEEKKQIDLNNTLNKKIFFEFLLEKIKNEQKKSKKFKDFLSGKDVLRKIEIFEVNFFLIF